MVSNKLLVSSTLFVDVHDASVPLDTYGQDIITQEFIDFLTYFVMILLNFLQQEKGKAKEMIDDCTHLDSVFLLLSESFPE